MTATRTKAPGSNIFYAKAYPGRVSDYLPAPDGSPTPLQHVDGDHLWNAESGSNKGGAHVRTLYQGFNRLSTLHDYSYGSSNPGLRPLVDSDSEDEWLMSIDPHYVPALRGLTPRNRSPRLRCMPPRELTKASIDNILARLSDDTRQHADVVRAHDHVHPDRTDCGGLGNCLLMKTELDAEEEILESLKVVARKNLSVGVSLS